jgi:hypothetical protein
MKTLTTYQCEICNSVFDAEKDAIECEAKGMPEPVPWLKLNEDIPAFGEDGVVMAKVTHIWVESYSGYCHAPHEWYVSSRAYLSHNQSDGGVHSVNAFDPRKGYDPFRYSCSKEDVRIWTETMAKYGFAEDTANEYVLEKITSARAKYVEAK